MPKRDFVSHLEELRRRLIVVLIVFFAASVFAYFFSHSILDFLSQPLRKFQGVTLFFQKPHEAFLIHLKVAGFAGFILSLPVILSQVWLFIAPGLYEKEKKILVPLVGITLFLFLVGSFFAYAVVVPWGLQFLLSFQTESLKPMIGAGPYFSFLTGMVLSFGVLFDFPVFINGLVLLNVVDRNTLAQGRKLVIILLFVLAAILTPSADPLSQLLLAIPLILLFEVSLVIAGLLEKKRDSLLGK